MPTPPIRPPPEPCAAAASPSRRAILQLATAGALGLPALRSRGAGGPSGKVLFGFLPQGVAEALSRKVLPALVGLYTPELDTHLTFLTGNSSMRAFEALLKAPDDGSAVLLAPSSTLTLMPLLRGSAASTAGSASSELRAVVPLIEVGFVYCIGKGVPAEIKTLADYAEWVAESPGKATFCVPGLGTASHLMGLAMARGMKLPLKPVAYQGSPPILRELLAGTQPAGALVISSALAAIASGEVRPLFVGSAARWPGLPEVPALRELMSTEIDVAETLGFHMRASVSEAKVGELNDATQRVLATPDLQAFARSTAARIALASAAAYTESLAAERRRWDRLMRTELFGIAS